ncbi:hypothetical protein ACFQZC_07085 [Streptacidiphilus monticola]
MDTANGLSLTIPSGWQGGTTKDGDAAMYYGSYSCPGTSGSTCSYAGADTTTLKTPVSTGVKAAAEADITAAVKESYSETTGHTQLLSQSVTVAGRQGYLIRWKVDAKVGNNGTVETVVFPSSSGKQLVALHMGFDESDKAPDLALMDTILKSVQDYSGSGGGSTTTS